MEGAGESVTLLEMQRAAIEWFNRCMYSAVDHQFMSQALAEAQKALYLSNPNPRVGCVIVKDGQVIGSGFTQKVGSAHAEVQEHAVFHVPPVFHPQRLRRIREARLGGGCE